MRLCSKCGLVKDESEFNRDKSRKDGLQCWCYDCQSPIIQKWGREHPEKNREKVARYKKKNPDVVLAHNTVNNAIRAGTLVREICEVEDCDVIGQAHHDDYSKPLDVEWLCRKHHNKLEKRRCV